MVLTPFNHLNHIFNKCTSDLINPDFIDVLHHVLHLENSFHLVYTNVAMVTWSDMVLRIVQFLHISPVFQHINGNLMLVIINFAIIILKKTNRRPY